MNQQLRLRKFTRDPEYGLRHKGKRLTDTSLAILSAIERYRVIPTSLLLRLIQANPRVGYRHLQHLYHSGFANRFCFFGPTGRPQEFNYFLDNPEALNLLIDRSVRDPDTLDFDQIKRNREKWTPVLVIHRYGGRGAAAAVDNQLEQVQSSEGQRLFLRHELMISRFHWMLEMAAKASQGRVKLMAFQQGPKLFRSIVTPKVVHRDGEWHQLDGDETIPHRPDAFFSIQVAGEDEPKHFFYEADRKTTGISRMIRKLRGHFYYIAKTRQHKTDYGVDRIRAVLIETLDVHWAEAVRIAAQHPIVSGPKPSELFWFTASEFFTKPIPTPAINTVDRIRHTPTYIQSPETLFRPLWFTPVDAAGAQPRSFLD